MNQASFYFFRPLGITLVLLGVCLALGCGGPTQMTVLATYSPAAGGDGPIPLRAGLVLTNSFRTATAAGGYGGAGFTADIGPALTQASENLVRAAFRDMVVINVDDASRIEALAVPPGVDVLVIPVIKNVSAPIRKIGAIREAWRGQVVIVWNIVRDGKTVYANAFTGESSEFGQSMKEALARALKNHFDQAYQGIVTSSWWKTR